jgi:hypothetical protein
MCNRVILIAKSERTSIVSVLKTFFVSTEKITTTKALESSASIAALENIILLTLGASLSSHLIFGLVIYFLNWRHFWFTLGLATAGVRLMSVAPEDQDEASHG